MPASSWWFVYLVRCRDGSLYTGITNDLEARIATHNAGRGARYTRSRLPVELVHVERKRTRSSALRREHAVKALSRAEKLTLVTTVPPRLRPEKQTRPRTGAPPTTATTRVRRSEAPPGLSRQRTRAHPH